MTTADTQTHAKTPKAAGRFRLPDPPRREPDEMTQYDKLFKTGRSRDLAIHLGNPETTLVEADRWIVADTSFNKARARRPDLLVAFDVDPEIYRANNGYIVSEQGKPPDFVLEVASESTGDADVGVKRDYYQSLRIREYWRFDETGPVSRNAAGRRPAGRRPLRTHRHRRVGVGRVAGIQHGVESASPLGTGRSGLVRPGYGPAHRHAGGRTGARRPGAGDADAGGSAGAGTGRAAPAPSKSGLTPCRRRTTIIAEPPRYTGVAYPIARLSRRPP